MEAEHLAQCRGWSRKDIPRKVTYELAPDDRAQVTQRRVVWGTEKNAFYEPVWECLGG